MHRVVVCWGRGLLGGQHCSSACHTAMDGARRRTASHEKRATLMAVGIASAVLAAILSLPCAFAEDVTSYNHLEAPAGVLEPCRYGMLLNLAPYWQAGDGAATVLTSGQTADVSRDVLVSTLLTERAVVLELVPLRYEGAPALQSSVITGAIDALEALTLTMRAGMTMTLVYGPGGKDILDVVRAPQAALPGSDWTHCVAAVAVGDRFPAFARRRPHQARERAPARLAALCRALGAVLGPMGATPPSSEPLTACEAYVTAMSDVVPPSRQVIWPTGGENSGPPDGERTVLQVEAAAGVLELPPGSACRRLPGAAPDGGASLYTEAYVGAGSAVPVRE